MAMYDEETGVLWVDNTTLSSVATCSTKATLRHIFNRVPYKPNMPAEAGSAIHKGLEVYWRTGCREDALFVFEEAYRELADANTEPDDRLSYTNVAGIFESYLRTHRRQDAPFVILPEWIEQSFDLPLSDDGMVRYVGRLDALVRPRGQANVAYVLDTKSTMRIDYKFREQFRIGSQMTGYVWAAQQLAPLPVAGIWINAIHVPRAPSSNRKCAKHGVAYSECGSAHANHEYLGPYLRAPVEIASWREDALDLAYKFLNLIYDMRKGGPSLHALIPQEGRWIYQACPLCEFHGICQAGRKGYHIEAETYEKAWDPRNAAYENAEKNNERL